MMLIENNVIMNKSIDEYTIHCTAEQAKKALKLGASIEFEQTFRYNWKDGKREPYPDIEVDKNGEPILIKPTAEQMIGWLEEKGFLFYICKDPVNENVWDYSICYKTIKNKIIGAINFKIKREATLAAIDVALDYLDKQQKE